MIEAVLYQTVYLLIVAFFTIRAVSLYGNKGRGVVANQKQALFLAVFMIFFIGLFHQSYSLLKLVDVSYSTYLPLYICKFR